MTTPIREEAAGAAETYLALARLFDYPGRSSWEALERDLAAGGPAPAWARPAIEELSALSAGDREAAFLDAFELGGVPPYEGHLLAHKGREGILQELLAFYHFFGLRLAGHQRDYPDHLCTELEFMAYLAAQEARAEEKGGDPGEFRSAQRDFLARHLREWVPVLTARLTAAERRSPYGSLAEALSTFLAGEITRLEHLTGPEGATA